ncbi:MAG: type II toxin-antitoxin system antitoxin [Gemmatimonadales bacterium]
MAERKSVLIRIDPTLHESLQRWAADEFRSLNGQIEYALKQALAQAGRGRARGRGPTESDSSSSEQS